MRSDQPHVMDEADATWVRIANAVTRDWLAVVYTDDHDDVLSDAMLGIAQALKTWEPGRVPLPVYAYRKARFAVIEGYRNNRGPVTRSEWKKGVRVQDLPKHRRTPVSTDAMRDAHDALPVVQVIDLRASEVFEQVDVVLELDGLLEQLRPSHRRVLVLHDLLGYSQAEIAADLDVTPSRVCQLRKAGMTRLRELAGR